MNPHQWRAIVAYPDGHTATYSFRSHAWALTFARIAAAPDMQAISPRRVYVRKAGRS